MWRTEKRPRVQMPRMDDVPASWPQSPEQRTRPSHQESDRPIRLKSTLIKWNNQLPTMLNLNALKWVYNLHMFDNIVNWVLIKFFVFIDFAQFLTSCGWVDSSEVCVLAVLFNSGWVISYILRKENVVRWSFRNWCKYLSVLCRKCAII